MESISRRTFINRAVRAGAAVSMPGAFSGRSASRGIWGANDAVRVAIAGLRIKGSQHVDLFRQIPGVRVVALCDPDGGILDGEMDKFRTRNETVEGFRDVREVLDRRDVDALVIAAPNHWHALMAVWACQAGKDVYVEKPVSHSIWEGRRIVDAAGHYGRIVQCGTQNRSDEGFGEFVSWLRQGEIGRVKTARGFCYKRRESIGIAGGPQPIPRDVDYDLWTGPAKLLPLMRKQLHYDWHWDWNTGNGDIGNQGVHELDMCRWALDEQGLPAAVTSVGGRFGYADDGQTPNTQAVLFEYSVPLIFEVRGLPRKTGDPAMDAYRDVRIGVVIECEGGIFAGGSGGGWVYDSSGARIRQFTCSGGSGHAANFIQAVRSRKRSYLAADIREGHVSSALCHIANISHRLGQAASLTGIPEILVQPEYREAFGRMREHLESNGVHSDENAVMGPRLDFEAEKEQFVSKAEYDAGFWANTMLKREYRHPFTVPDKFE